MSVVVMILPKVLEDARILENVKVGPGIFRMLVESPRVAGEALPGQFVQLRLLSGDFLLRRPLGIAERSSDLEGFSLFYRVVGRGTEALSHLAAGETVNLLGPLGNGFSRNYSHPLLVGGGLGLSPLLSVAEYYGDRAEVLMGGKTAGELFWQDFYKPFTEQIHITTDDGSLGEKGFTTALLPKLLEKGSYDGILVCGPEIMMRGVAEIAERHGIPCEVSLEKRMACGLGACLSCVIDTADGTRKKVCKDGPVFSAQEVFFS